jgi:predicted nucleotidyltransferase
VIDRLVIEPQHLDILRPLLATYLPPETQVWAYGSRATGRHIRRGSDLDVMLRANEPLDIGVLGMLAEDFSESLLPFAVDVHDWHRTSAEFIARIEPDLVRVPMLTD